MKTMPEPLLEVSDVAKHLRVRPAWVYEKCHRGKMPHYKVGHYIRFRASEVEAWLQAERRGPGSDDGGGSQ